MTAHEALQAIRERVDKATPGPWERHTAPGDSGVSKGEWLADTCRGDDPLQVLVSASDDPQFDYLVPAVTGDGPTSIANAEFIASARGDVPKLLDALTAVLGNHWCIEGGEECGFDGRCWPCPDYRAITEALS